MGFAALLGLLYMMLVMLRIARGALTRAQLRFPGPGVA
jgi:hypothetical protein